MSKLITLLLLIGAVYMLWRWQSRIERTRREAARAAAEPRVATETMVKCQSCGVYVPARGARDCGKAECPYRR